MSKKPTVISIKKYEELVLELERQKRLTAKISDDVAEFRGKFEQCEPMASLMGNRGRTPTLDEIHRGHKSIKADLEKVGRHLGRQLDAVRAESFEYQDDCHDKSFEECLSVLTLTITAKDTEILARDEQIAAKDEQIVSLLRGISAIGTALDGRSLA